MVVLYPNSGVLYEGAKPCWRVGEDEIRVGQVRMDVFFEMSQIRAYVLVGKVFNFKTACGLSKAFKWGGTPHTPLNGAVSKWQHLVHVAVSLLLGSDIVHRMD